MKTLPERIPVHFNLRGEPDRWTSDPAVIWFLLPVVSTLLVLMFLYIGRLSRGRPQLWNIPEKKRFLALTPEQREPILARLLGVMDVAALYTCVLLFYVQTAIYQSARSGAAQLGWSFHILIWGGLILLLVHTFRVQDEVRRAGFIRIRVDGQSHNVEEPPSIDHRRHHNVEVIVDRVVVRPETGGQRSPRTRIADAVEAALDLGRGVLHVAHVEDAKAEPKWRVEKYSQHFACQQCGRSFERLNPHHFSFNSPLGWCRTCEGLGVQKGANAALLIRDPKLSLRDGALSAWPDLRENATFLRFAEALARHGGFSLDTPFDQLTSEQQGQYELAFNVLLVRQPDGSMRIATDVLGLLAAHLGGLERLLDPAR